MKIAVSADRSRITMRKGKWSLTCPAADLGKWVDLYTGLRDRAGGRFASFYADDVADLVAAQKKLKAG